MMLAPFLHPAGISVFGDVGEATLRQWGYAGPVARGPDPACDVALVATAADGVLAALEACAGAGIMHAVALAGGFEATAGAARRADLRAFLASVPSFRLIGPNCAGVMSAATGTILSTSGALLQEPATVGGAGLVLQSGGIGSGLLLTLLRRGAGFAHWVTTGDELGIGALEVAAAMVDDPACTAVGLFLEGITDAQWLPGLAGAISRTTKPVIALRSGLSAGGRRAAFGHTGRVVGDGEIARAALQQAGVRLVDTLDELSDALTVLSVLPARRSSGEATVGVVTAAGGSGVLAADAIAATPNLRLASLSAGAVDAMTREVGSGMPVANPYDMPSLGDPEVFRRAVRAMGNHSGCDVLVVVTTTLAHDYERIAGDDFAGLPPMAVAHLSTDERFTPQQSRRLAAAGIPNVPSVQHAVAAVADWAGRTGPVADSPADRRRPGRRLGFIRSREAVPALAPWMAPAETVRSAPEAVAVAARIGGCVAVKAEGTHVEHRTELGAVRVGLCDEQALERAYAAVGTVCAVPGDAVVVQAMAPEGIEVLVAAVRDAELGPVALFRPGGTLVELAGTTTFLTGSPATWPAVLDRSEVGQLLGGYRGAKAADAAGVLDLAAVLVAAMAADDRIAGIECNPVVVHHLDRRPGTRPATIVDVVTHLFS